MGVMALIPILLSGRLEQQVQASCQAAPERLERSDLLALLRTAASVSRWTPGQS